MELKQFHDMGEHVLDRAGGLNHVTTPSFCIFPLDRKRGSFQNVHWLPICNVGSSGEHKAVSANGVNFQLTS